MDLTLCSYTVHTRLSNPTGEKRLALSTNTGVIPKHFFPNTMKQKRPLRDKVSQGIVYNENDHAG